MQNLTFLLIKQAASTPVNLPEFKVDDCRENVCLLSCNEPMYTLPYIADMKRQVICHSEDGRNYDWYLPDLKKLSKNDFDCISRYKFLNQCTIESECVDKVSELFSSDLEVPSNATLIDFNDEYYEYENEVTAEIEDESSKENTYGNDQNYTTISYVTQTEYHINSSEEYENYWSHQGNIMEDRPLMYLHVDAYRPYSRCYTSKICKFMCRVNRKTREHKPCNLYNPQDQSCTLIVRAACMICRPNCKLHGVVWD